METVEIVSDNEVTIAAIEADKEIQIAEINAEARINEAEAYAEAQAPQDDDKWSILERLVSTLETVENRLANLEQVQTSSLLVETLEAEAMEEVAEELNDLTVPSMSVPTSETQTEATLKSEEESPAVLPPILEVKGKPIIRLV